MELRTSFGRTITMNSERAAFLLAVGRVVKNRMTTEEVCPLCGRGAIQVQYVGDVHARIGYCRAWCDSCNRGIHISRVQIPEFAEVIPFEAAVGLHEFAELDEP